MFLRPVAILCGGLERRIRMIEPLIETLSLLDGPGHCKPSARRGRPAAVPTPGFIIF
jgi:hypothetical protein